MVTFVNQLTGNVTPQYASCILAAEQFISSHWTNPVTVTLSFDAQPFAVDSLQLDAFPVYGGSFSYTALRTALAAHANNPDAQAAVAALPATDPTAGYGGSHSWPLPQAYARMLGLSP